jgi:hypothetical protein
MRALGTLLPSVAEYSVLRRLISSVLSKLIFILTGKFLKVNFL